MISVDSHERAGWTVVSASGEVDVVSAPALRAAIVNAVTAGQIHLVLDLSGVVFIDSFGLGVLVGAVKRVQTHSGRLRVVIADSRVRAVVELTGLDRILDLHDDVDRAVAESPSDGG